MEPPAQPLLLGRLPSSFPTFGGDLRARERIHREVEPISKRRLSSDRSLQFDSVKLESLVIADQNAAVNTFPGLVHTARHTTKAGCTRSR